MKRHHSIGLIAVAIAIGASLLLWPSGPSDSPPKIVHGQDRCARCNRTLMQPGFGGATRVSEGPHAAYDDLGCLLLDWLAAGDGRPAWVEDRGDGHLFTIERAFFVRGETVVTPNAYGIVAFDSPEVARRYALDKHAKVVGLADLRAARPALEAHERDLQRASRNDNQIEPR